jgi:hypothetical protein
MLKALALVLFLTAPTALIAQEQVTLPSGFPRNVGEPPRVAPDGCPLSLIADMSTLQGTDAYRYTRRQVAALSLGRHANDNVVSALSSGDHSSTEVHELVRMITGLTDAQNGFLCASFVIGLKKPTGANRPTLNQFTIAVYNRLALNVWQVQSRLLEIARNPEAAQNNSPASNAEAIAALEQDRKTADSDLYSATTMLAMLLLDPDHPHAGIVNALKITCKERQELLDDLVPVTKPGGGAFMENAILLRDFLRKRHRCHP